MHVHVTYMHVHCDLCVGVWWGRAATCPSSTHILFDHSSHLFVSFPARTTEYSTHVDVFMTLAMLMYNLLCTMYMYLESSLNSNESVAILVNTAVTEAH